MKKSYSCNKQLFQIYIIILNKVFHTLFRIFYCIGGLKNGRRVRICDCCGREIADGEETIVENDVLCQSCVEDYCIACDHCGDMIYTENCITDDHTWLCQECYDDYYHRCENCDRIINDDDTCWRNDFPYCSYCYDELDSDDEIEDMILDMEFIDENEEVEI